MISDSDTITLKDAAQHFGFSVYTLRTEAENGRLVIYKIGKRYYTTPADIKEMIRLMVLLSSGGWLARRVF